MTEPDSELSRRYRAASREEPPAALDAAILAASRRAVGARPGGMRRWAGPVSIAAVLMLGVGLSLRMQQEKPGIETSAPSAEYSAAAPAPAQVPSPAQAPESPPVLSREAAPRAEETRARAQGAPARADKRTTAAAKPAPMEADALQKRAPALVAQDAAVTVAPEANVAAAPPPMAPPSVAAAAAPAARSKREALASSSDAAAAAADSHNPAVIELERIARLRSEGLDAEADKALEEFRRKFPDYRIDEAMWRRVKPR